MSLKRHLDAFIEQFPKEQHVRHDPVQFVHRFELPIDREIVGLLSAAFAYGNVRSVLETGHRVLAILGTSPSRFISTFDPSRDLRRIEGFYHRFNTDRDLAVFLWMIRRTLENHGSLESAFAINLKPEHETMQVALEGFVDGMLATGFERFYPRGELKRRLGVRFLLPAPSSGSACKRLNLFLRWMARPSDGVDCGVWPRVGTRRLLMPVDTHIARISRYVGLTSLRSAGWSMAIDITRSLRKLDPEDPVRYDFALCHLGIARACPRHRDVVKCQQCPIQEICLL